MKFIILLLTSCILYISSLAQNTITLRRSFIDSFKNRVTITAQYDVWFTHHTPHSAADDGDIHVAGYDKEIGMPTVAEVMNAKDEKESIDLFIAHEGKGKPNNPKLPLTGVWRLWPEHMGTGADFFQGMKLSQTTIKKKKTNPDHVFEIHPLTTVGTIDVVGSLRNIEGYNPKGASEAFKVIRSKPFSISSAKKTISFQTKIVGQNYIDLWIRIDTLWDVDDGAFAYCTVLDSNFHPNTDDVAHKTVSPKTRVVFVKDSECFKQVKQKQLGDFMHILGTPRVDLAILSWRESVSKTRPEVLTWKLPFEIIADGIIE